MTGEPAPDAVAGLSLAVVVAHPDDDAYGAAPFVAAHADDPGFRFILVHATDGGAGDIHPDFPATRETLGRIRQEEDRNAWRAVGREPDRHVWLDLPDGAVGDVPIEDLAGLVGGILEEEQPTVVMTFGPDGISGHPDHIAIGAATDAAFARAARSSGTAFRRLLHNAIPQSVFERWQVQREELGWDRFDPTAVYHMRGVPDAEIGLVMDARAVSDRVVAGLLEHRSQHHVMATVPFDVERFRKLMRRTWAVVAWPRRRPGDPVLTGMFDGLP